MLEGLDYRTYCNWAVATSPCLSTSMFLIIMFSYSLFVDYDRFANTSTSHYEDDRQRPSSRIHGTPNMRYETMHCMYIFLLVFILIQEKFIYILILVAV